MRPGAGESGLQPGRRRTRALDRFDQGPLRAIHHFLDARLYGTAPTSGLDLRLLGVPADLTARFRSGLRREEQTDSCSNHRASRDECSPTSHLLSFVRHDNLLRATDVDDGFQPLKFLVIASASSVPDNKGLASALNTRLRLPPI